MILEGMSAILLAAGLSRRMGKQDKLLLMQGGKTLLAHAVTLLDSLPCREKILVISPQRLARITLPKGICVVINHNPQAGQSESLRLGLEKATGSQYLFLNADQPFLSLAALTPLLTLAKENVDNIIHPVVNAKPCSPVVFPARFRADLLAQTGDTGGRAVRAAHPQACLTFEPENPQDFMDIDCLEDYRRLTGGFNR